MKIKDCSELPEGSRLRQICEGSADLPDYKINAYRVKWGLPPLDNLPVRPQKVYNRSIERKVVKPTRIIKRTGNKPPTVELGDAVADTLKKFGITPERVSKWIGRPCGCKKRQEKLNKLSRWAREVITGTKQEAIEQLDDMINE